MDEGPEPPVFGKPVAEAPWTQTNTPAGSRVQPLLRVQGGELCAERTASSSSSGRVGSITLNRTQSATRSALQMEFLSGALIDRGGGVVGFGG